MRRPLQCVLDITKSAGILRARDLDGHGIARQYLVIAKERGLIERRGRGLYALAGRPPGEMHLLAEAAIRVPRGVVCLDSALRLHGLRSGPPGQVWLAIGDKDRRPTVSEVPLRICRFSVEALQFGVEVVLIDGVPVRVFSVAKTIADCFKYRRKIGSDTAVEVLRDALQKRVVTPGKLETAAAVCRVSNVLQPYLALARFVLGPNVARKSVASAGKSRREKTA